MSQCRVEQSSEGSRSAKQACASQANQQKTDCFMTEEFQCREQTPHSSTGEVETVRQINIQRSSELENKVWRHSFTAALYDS